MLLQRCFESVQHAEQAPSAESFGAQAGAKPCKPLLSLGCFAQVNHANANVAERRLVRSIDSCRKRLQAASSSTTCAARAAVSEELCALRLYGRLRQGPILATILHLRKFPSQTARAPQTILESRFRHSAQNHHANEIELACPSRPLLDSESCGMTS